MKKNINQIIKEEINRFLSNNLIKENCHLLDLDELMEYMWLKPQVSNLNVDIFIDDGGAYERYGHPLLLYVRNGYNKSINEFIPFSISEKPYVLDDEMEFHISYEDIFSVMDFIQINLDILNAMSQSQISHEDFVSHIQVVPAYAIAEGKCLLSEMATLRTNDSDLPVDIWLDEGATYQGHAPRIKFRASNEQRTTREFSSMLITDPSQIENMPDNSPLRKKDIKKIQDFVINNKDLLLQLANGEIDYRTDFLPNMVKQ